MRNASTLESVVVAIGHWPRGMDILVSRNLNTELESLDVNEHDKAITAATTMEGLADTVEHLIPQKHMWTRDVRIWSMLRCGQDVRSRTDCILGTDRRMFQNVAIQEPRHNTDYFMVLECLHDVNLR